MIAKQFAFATTHCHADKSPETPPTDRALFWTNEKGVSEENSF